MSWTGMVDEETFKAMHELRTDAPPKLFGEMIDLAGGKAYLSLPPGKTGPLPAVVVIHEWWGLNDHVKHWADRLAADGYAALAVDLYAGAIATTPDQAMAAMKAVDATKAKATLAAAHEYLRAEPRITASRRGVIGWCFGGAWSLQHAIAQSDLDAAVIYYGRLVDDPKELAKIRAPLLGVFGDRDRGIPPEAVAKFAAAVKAAGKSLELHQYDAEHAFANPSNPKYDAKASADAWSHVRAFFEANLRAAK
jgi:carboxymethylenebutenolidase